MIDDLETLTKRIECFEDSYFIAKVLREMADDSSSSCAYFLTEAAENLVGMYSMVNQFAFHIAKGRIKDSSE